MTERGADPEWDEAKRRAVELRKQGHTYEEIAELVSGERATFTAWFIYRGCNPYQVRYSCDHHEQVAKAAIHSRHEHIDDAAREFIRLTAPFKQVVVEEGGELEFLDELEEARLQELCNAAGYEVEEIDGAAPRL